MSKGIDVQAKFEDFLVELDEHIQIFYLPFYKIMANDLASTPRSYPRTRSITSYSFKDLLEYVNNPNFTLNDMQKTV